MLKLALISFIILFAVLTGISLLIPSHIRISKAMNMKTDPRQIWKKVDDLRHWEEWNPWFSDFASKKVEYTDTTNGRWNAIKVGMTTVKWKEKEGDEHVVEMQSGNRAPVMSGWKCIEGNHPAADSMVVQWWMDFRLRWYPWEKFGSLLYEKKYGVAMERGLINLKELVEK